MEEITYEPIFAPLTIGDEVPKDITFDVFQNEKIESTSFGAFRDKWLILFFYPKDFTFVCPTELGEMAHLYEEFKKLNAEVVSVSTDTPFVHKAWHDVSDTIKQIQYPMAADPSHELSELFGVLVEEDGSALRGTFIISPDGEIKTIEIHGDAIGRSGKETLRKLKAAIHVGNNPANVCPASWDEGDDTLTPGVDLVGKI